MQSLKDHICRGETQVVQDSWVFFTYPKTSNKKKVNGTIFFGICNHKYTSPSILEYILYVIQFPHSVSNHKSKFSSTRKFQSFHFKPSIRYAELWLILWDLLGLQNSEIVFAHPCTYHPVKSSANITIPENKITFTLFSYEHLLCILKHLFIIVFNLATTMLNGNQNYLHFVMCFQNIIISSAENRCAKTLKHTTHGIIRFYLLFISSTLIIKVEDMTFSNNIEINS
ncbi:hypothetical protein Bhyg_00863 [Pseudolycoriella hygida]|uniref:Uncharacterized protein n=1 Tax=Pseudolycoriella hygida TaxID=35572 RepID=A0A9Q0N8B4_9DIPT|nr:hypothetical protein Bhyg_00863 [Pseudolycoriella hygida]